MPDAVSLEVKLWGYIVIWALSGEWRLQMILFHPQPTYYEHPSSWMGNMRSAHCELRSARAEICELWVASGAEQLINKWNGNNNAGPWPQHAPLTVTSSFPVGCAGKLRARTTKFTILWESGGWWCDAIREIDGDGDGDGDGGQTWTDSSWHCGSAKPKPKPNEDASAQLIETKKKGNIHTHTYVCVAIIIIMKICDS